jgi:hypothetical protein
MRKIGMGVAAAAAVAATIALPMGQASAGESYGSCSAAGFKANVSVTYHTDGSYDVFNNWWWDLQGPQIGNSNNLDLQVKRVNPTGTNPVLDSWSSDTVRGRVRASKTINAKVLRSQEAYGAFQVIFDRPDASDPRCDGKTSEF